MGDDTYCYKKTNVLKNKFGIKDLEQLAIVERKFSISRIAELEVAPIQGNFDLKHIQTIHKYIFQDVYAWAGKIRTVDIAKNNMFCRAVLVRSQAKTLFENLSEENYLRNCNADELPQRMAYYFSELNAIHPFREGNGRAQREFIRCLALKNGYKMLFGEVCEEEMIEASQASFLCDYRAMEEIFKKFLKKIK